MRAGGRTYGNFLVPEGPAAAALQGRAEANTFLFSSIMAFPFFQQILYFADIIFAISASDPLPALWL